MRIYGITNSINFGYNKELNDKVNKKLENARGNKELAKTLLEMNKFCNQTEDKLRKAEQENNLRLANTYADLLVNLKPTITEVLDERFPLLKYKDSERKSYQKEIIDRELDKKEEYHWIEEISDDLDPEFPQAYLIGSFADMSDTDKGVATQANPTVKEDKIPSALEEFKPTEYSPKGLSSLGGMEDVKELFQDKIIIPLNNPEIAQLDEVEYGKKAPRGVLLYGPPGCGKTSCIEALAGETSLPLYKLKIAKAGSKYINQSSTNIQNAYEYAKKIAQDKNTPVLLAIDEMESITPKRKEDGDSAEDNKMVGTLLQIIEEARGNNVFIIGATNMYDSIDDAVKSRLEDKIYIGLPDDETRKKVLQIHLNKRTKGQNLASNDEELAKVVDLTKGFSNRDIAILTDKASLVARKDNRRDICAQDFVQPVNENQNMKVKESIYKDKQTKSSVGFTTKK